MLGQRPGLGRQTGPRPCGQGTGRLGRAGRSGRHGDREGTTMGRWVSPVALEGQRSGLEQGLDLFCRVGRRVSVSLLACGV